MKPIILMYHSVAGDKPLDLYGVSKRCFYEQISWLIDQDYHFVALDTLVKSKKNGIFGSKRKQVILTFDDGYQDFFVHALPILKQYRIPATVFLVTDMLGNISNWSSQNLEIPLMTDTEVQQVKCQGIDLGSHTLSHVDLTTLGTEELVRQLVSSRLKLADFGETFFPFSYPWGKYSTREIAALKDVGYECAVTAEWTTRISRFDLYRLGRLTMRDGLDLASFKKLILGSTWPRQVYALVQDLLRRARNKVS